MKKSNTPIPSYNQVESKLSELPFILILITGSAFRLYDLNRGLWPDEIHNWQNFSSQSISHITTRFLPAFNHIFHSILVWLSTQIFNSQSELVIRIPAVTFGILQIWATYKLAEYLYKNKNVAILSTLIIALSPAHVFFSQAARGYSILTCLATLALYFLLKAKEKPKYWIGFVVCSVLATYSIITGVFFVVALFVWYMIFVYWAEKRDNNAKTKKSSSNYALIAFGLTFTLIILLHLPVAKELLSYKGRGTLNEYSFWPIVDGSMKQLYYYCTKGMSDFITICCLLGLAATFKSDKKIASLFLLIFIIPFFLTYLSKAASFGRTFLFDLPIFYILAAYGSWTASEFLAKKTNFKPRYATIGLALLFGTFYGYYMLSSYYADKDGNYKKTAQYLTTELKKSNYSDLLITEWNHDWANAFYMGEEMGQCLKQAYLTGNLNNLYITTDKASTIFHDRKFYGLDKMRFWAIFGENPRLDWRIPKEKMELVKGYKSSQIYRMRTKQKLNLFAQADQNDFGSKLRWKQLSTGNKFNLYVDSNNTFKGENSLVFISPKQPSPNLIISEEKFNTHIPANSIILLLYAQPANQNNLATFYFTDKSGRANPLQMVYINRMNNKNHIFKKGEAYWKITAQLYITTREMANPGLLLISTGQARYDDFVAFILN